MTIAEMFKKIATYNEISEVIGVREKVGLCMIDESVVRSFFTAEDAKSLKKEIKDTYIDCCADAILNYKGFEFNTPVTFETVDKFGYTVKTTVEFIAEVK